MATPTLAEVKAQWNAAVDILESNRAYFDGTMVADLDTMEQALEGDYTPLGLAQWGADVRGLASSMVSRQSARQALIPCVREYGKLIQSDLRNPDAIFQDICRYMRANSLTVNSRGITYNSFSAGGGNTGDGTWQRLTVDEYGDNLEAVTIELKTIRCVQDGNLGANRHEEAFDLYGVEGPKDWLDIANAGTGRRLRNVRAVHAGSGSWGSRLVNSSFTNYTSGGTVTTLYRGWTIHGSTSNFGTDTTNYYRGHPGDGDAPRSLIFTGNDKITQKLSVSGTRLRRDIPMYCRVMYNRQVGSGDGTLTLRCGSASANVSLVAQTGWNELKIAVGTSCWPANFYEDEIDIEIELSSNTTGSVRVQDVIFAPWTFWDGAWVIGIGGAVPFVLEDVFTSTDSGGTAASAKVQYYNWLAGFGYMPSVANGSETWSDPS